MIRTQSLPSAYQTAASNDRHRIVADAPADKGGAGTGFGAHELLEASLAVCIVCELELAATVRATGRAFASSLLERWHFRDSKVLEIKAHYFNAM